MKKVEVIPHDPKWRGAFEAESTSVAVALGVNIVAIHHIGSTSIPGIYAKPIIDILVEVNDIDEVDRCSRAMRSIGYEVMGEFGIAGRRYFRKDAESGVRTHHIHAFEVGSDHIRRHLAFRDHLIAYPDEALEYSDLKRRLAADHADDADAYMDGKDAFIRDVDRRLSTEVLD